VKRLLTLLFSILLLSACSISNRRDGVDNRWRKIPVRAFKNGMTRESEVLQNLGPPTRVIALKKRTVFYYLLEHDYSVGLNLIVFINRDTVVKYDRAVFFFNDKGILENHSFSKEDLSKDDED
jgi:hypothetical protein